MKRTEVVIVDNQDKSLPKEIKELLGKIAQDE
jgi:hypothetical protein